jgi:hypothetical protein
VLFVINGEGATDPLMNDLRLTNVVVGPILVGSVTFAIQVNPSWKDSSQLATKSPTNVGRTKRKKVKSNVNQDTAMVL